MFIADPAVVFNVFWLLTIVLTGWTCLFSLRILGVPSWLAALSGVLYACLPFTWMRSTSHLSLVFYSVPLLWCLCRLPRSRTCPAVDRCDLPSRRPAGRTRAGFRLRVFQLVCGSAVRMAGMLGYARCAAGPLTWAGVASASSDSPRPSIWRHRSTLEETRKAGIGYKTRGRSRTLRPQDSTPAAAAPRQPRSAAANGGRRWTARLTFPNENENGTTRLGMFGALGFLLVLRVSLRGGSRGEADARRFERWRR